MYLGKALISNIFDFKYYFAKHYISDAYAMLAPSTRSFIQQNAYQNINTDNPAYRKVELNVPVKDIYNEIHKIKKYLRNYRGVAMLGLVSLVVPLRSHIVSSFL